MKKNYKFLAILLVIFTTFSFASNAQNVGINLLFCCNGTVAVGQTGQLQIDINNTGNGGTGLVPSNKIRAQVSMPTNITITNITLPSGWSIPSNVNNVIFLCNGTDNFPTNSTRTIIVDFTANMVMPSQTATGTMKFGNGANCNALPPPTALPGDLSGDNISTSAIVVTSVAAVNSLIFDAVLTNCQPQLKWSTENEQNSATFEIERGNTNNNAWTTIASVNAAGNSTTKKEYTYTDVNPASEGKALYRLKVIDINGTYKYSKIIPIGNCKTADVIVYPNPTKDGKINVTISGFGKNITSILTSSVGQLIKNKTVINGTNTIDVSSVANGLYFLTVNDSDGNLKQVTVNLAK